MAARDRAKQRTIANENGGKPFDVGPERHEISLRLTRRVGHRAQSSVRVNST